jgi:N-acetylmuramoyl-L-alanine amidase
LDRGSSSEGKKQKILLAIRDDNCIGAARSSRHALPLAIILPAVLITVCMFAVILFAGNGLWLPEEAGVKSGSVREPAPRSVCLDPGHSMGGSSSSIDPESGLDVADCLGETGEIKAVWELALTLKAKLERAGYKVRLTKKSMVSYVDLKTRADIGNTCSIMVRLHSDTSFKAVFHPAVGQFKAHDGKRVDVNQTVAVYSTKLALAMFPFLKEVGVPRVMEEMGGHTDNTGSAYVVSALSRVPVVLIENDPLMLQDNSGGQGRVAEAIVKGIDTYFQSYGFNHDNKCTPSMNAEGEAVDGGRPAMVTSYYGTGEKRSEEVLGLYFTTYTIPDVLNEPTA